MKTHKVINMISFFLLSVFCGISLLHAQKIPDKILINENAGYSWNIQNYQFVLQQVDSKYGLFFCDSTSSLHFIKYIPSKDYLTLVEEIYKTGYDSLTIDLFSIDSTWLRLNAEKNIKKIPYYGKKSTQWTNEQKQFVIKELSNISNYNFALGRIIRLDGSFIIHQETSKIVELSLIFGTDTVLIKSNPLGLAYRIPWEFENQNKKSYNFGISRALLKILKNEWTYKEPQRSKKELIKQMIKEIFDSKCRDELYKLSPKQYSKELSELNPYFKILNAAEYGYRGRYVLNTPQVFKITLKNDLMKENVFLQYFITRKGNTLYPRSFIIHDHKQIISRIQSINFLMDFISKDTLRKIDIYCFDNKGINDYLIDGFNKNPKEWEKYDKWGTSEWLYCGCNFRFDNEYLQKAIMFELIDEFKNPSIWFLLPDDSVVLYHFQGDRCYKYTSSEYGTDGKTVQYACVKFDKQGNMIKREN